MLPPPDCPSMYVSLPDRWVGLEPSYLLLVRSLSVFAYYSCLIICGSDADKARLWWIAITECPVCALVSFVAAAQHVVFTSKTADPDIVGDGLGCSYQCLIVWLVE